MAYTINGVALAEVQSEHIREYTQTDPFPLPFNNSSNAELFAFAGNTREITIEGKLVATSVANLKTAIRAIGNVFNNLSGAGDQTQTAIATYNSDLHGSILVYLESFDHTYNARETGPLMVNYTLRMTEALTAAQ